ncbi:mitochondrial import inner membrane translocase subunit TIM23-1-like [Silene latifolia]|uniref:mitochondrial import inner membrane translocase subunit TIM23-1-like n=1 Tax=Silene latifolia TaxID=37657 RepID=UPI003D76EACF
MALNQNPENNNNPNNNPNPNYRLYNPYADLQFPSHKLYQLPTQPEFLFHEESIHQRRSWSENLTYYTGCGYLAGASTGASLGFYNGVRAIESGDTLKLRLNRVINSTGSTGRHWGNRVGVVGLMYACLESGLVYLRDDTDDILNCVVAGLATGALYKAASGPKAAAIAAAAGGICVGIMVGAKQAIKRVIPL